MIGFSKNGKNYIRVSRNALNMYLDIVSPNRRKFDDNDNKIYFSCSLKDKQKIWCDTCNSGIGSWSNACTKVISCINLIKYSEILMKDVDKDEKIDTQDFVTVEIDYNDDNKTI